MAASSTALKAAFTTEIAKISDTLQNAEAAYTLDRYIEALDKQNALEAGNVTSYTMAGRTFTKRNASDGQAIVQQLRADLNKFIYGTVTLLDNNHGVTEV